MRDRKAFRNVRFALPLALALCAPPAFASQNGAPAGTPSYAQTSQTPAQPDSSRQGRETTAADSSRQSRETAADGVAVLLNRLEQLLQQNNRDDFPSLLSTADITG